MNYPFHLWTRINIRPVEMSISITRQLISNVEGNMLENLDLKKISGRKRDLRWKTFRQTVLEDKSISFHSSPDTSMLSNNFLELIEEKCGDKLQISPESAPGTVLANNEHTYWDLRTSQGTLSVLKSAKTTAENRLKFAGHQNQDDATFWNVLADSNVSYAHGFGTAAFSAEEIQYIPSTMSLKEPPGSQVAESIPNTTVYCPYLFFNQAETCARHDIEWALNRCALDCSATLQALERLQSASRPDEKLNTHHSNLTLFSCAVSNNWAVLNHHWIANGKFCLAPLCKFDLRNHGHVLKLEAWIEAVGKWAELQLLPSIRRTLKTLSEWHEVMNDPLNVTPAYESERMAASVAGDRPPKINLIKQWSNSGAVESLTVFPHPVPATSMGLYFPPSTYESRQRILSWQRETNKWRDAPRSASLVPGKGFEQWSGPNSYSSFEKTTNATYVPDSFHTSQKVPEATLPRLLGSASRRDLHSMTKTCKGPQEPMRRDFRHCGLREIPNAPYRGEPPPVSLGDTMVLPPSQISLEMKSSFQLQPPSLQCSNVSAQASAIDLSSGGTKTNDVPAAVMHGSSTPGSSTRLDTSESNQKNNPAPEAFPKYQGVEEWARQQLKVLLRRDENTAPMQMPQRMVGPGQRTDLVLGSADIPNRFLQVLPESASPTGNGNDRASVTSWIEHVLGERVICIE